jgi:hypothetical protein
MKASGRRFFSDREYDFILRRISRDRADAELEDFHWRKYLSAALDVKPWAFGLIFFCTTTVAYAISYFMPIILNEEMGFSIGASLCLYAPPYAASAFVTYATAWFADKYRLRGPILIFNAFLCLVGLPLMVIDNINPKKQCRQLTIGLDIYAKHRAAPFWRVSDDNWSGWQCSSGNGLPSQ